jgi:hypothetical protein
MTVFILDTVTKSLRAKLTTSQATAAVHLTAHWADSTSDGTKVAESSYLRYSSGTASIEMVAAPSGSPLPKRDIINLSAVNRDSVPQTVVFYIDDGGIENDIFTVPLVTGQSWNSSQGIAASGGGGGGTGDMLKSTYDPNTDGIIAIAQGGTDANNAPDARTNLGLGNSATKDVGVIAGTVAAGDDARFGGGDMLKSVYDPNNDGIIGIVQGGTNATGTATARANLGLTIGSDVEAFDPTLFSIALLGTVADRTIFTSGTDSWMETPLTAAGRALIDDAAASDQRTTLGLGNAAVATIGLAAGNVAPGNTKLDDWATPDDNTDLDASTVQHGLMMKFPGGATYLRADGTWHTPAGGSGGGCPARSWFGV